MKRNALFLCILPYFAFSCNFSKVVDKHFGIVYTGASGFSKEKVFVELRILGKTVCVLFPVLDTVLFHNLLLRKGIYFSCFCYFKNAL